MKKVKPVKVETINGYRVEFFDNGTASALRSPGEGIAGPAAWVRKECWRFIDRGIRS